MLLNPYTAAGRERLTTLGDTNILQENFGIVGASFADVRNRFRRWTVHALYAPVSGRAVGGIRAKLADQKGYISFCNQRDLEVLLDVASPGAYCEWLGREYVELDDNEWIGLCCDEQDLVDDLFDRELEARAMYVEGAVLPAGLSLQRRIHDGYHNDFLEEMLLLWDICRETNMGPDTRYETVVNRWTSVERTPHAERAQLWLRTLS